MSTVIEAFPNYLYYRLFTYEVHCFSWSFLRVKTDFMVQENECESMVYMLKKLHYILFAVVVNVETVVQFLLIERNSELNS